VRQLTGDPVFECVRVRVHVRVCVCMCVCVCVSVHLQTMCRFRQERPICCPHTRSAMHGRTQFTPERTRHHRTSLSVRLTQTVRLTETVCDTACTVRVYMVLVDPSRSDQASVTGESFSWFGLNCALTMYAHRAKMVIYTRIKPAFQKLLLSPQNEPSARCVGLFQGSSLRIPPIDFAYWSLF